MSNKPLSIVTRLLLTLVLLATGLGAWVWWQNHQTDGPVTETPAPALHSQAIAHGAYLAQVGNCKGCHTARGGADFAGGLAIETPFGAIVSSNLTPDTQSGIGRWGNADFWRALHLGRSADGRLLYPAFPYEHFTHLTRQDSDALWAYFQSLPAQSTPPTVHTLRFPYNTQAALAVWRALYFKPAAPWTDQTDKDATWNRGAYLVEGLGHCAACHSERNAMGAIRAETHLAGGSMQPQGWWAPTLRAGEHGPKALAAATPANEAEQVALLQTGVSAHKVLMGPMAQVVASSLQYVQPNDLQAMVQYLQGLPPVASPPMAVATANPAVMAQGKKVYEDHCAQCHGDQGQGKPPAYPALAGNRGVNQAMASNVVKAIQNGGYAPSTQTNPRPYGMPPFRYTLSDDEMAAVATYIRQSWGNRASPVAGVALASRR
jgi:mono/diheme cytochrome c family protein